MSWTLDFLSVPVIKKSSPLLGQQFNFTPYFSSYLSFKPILSFPENSKSVLHCSSNNRVIFLQLRKANEGIDSFKRLISDVVETDRFYTFLETFRKDAEDQT